MASRTGIPSLATLAREMCRLITKYGFVITKLYPDNATLLAALTAAQTACSALHAELEAVREYGD